MEGNVMREIAARSLAGPGSVDRLITAVINRDPLTDPGQIKHMADIRSRPNKADPAISLDLVIHLD